MPHYANDVNKSESHNGLPKRRVFQAMWTGFKQKCPNCDKGKLFDRFLKVTDNCSHCGEALHHHRADDAPAYFTISIVGKIIVGLFVWVELAYQPSYWVHAALWIPALIIMALLALPLIKGAIVGLQWANYMHGFNPHFVEGDDVELPSEDTIAPQGAA
ncbi:MAG: DUF983 domain-containing protein [Hyphomicrobiales bacterium]